MKKIKPYNQVSIGDQAFENPVAGGEWNNKIGNIIWKGTYNELIYSKYTHLSNDWADMGPVEFDEYDLIIVAYPGQGNILFNYNNDPSGLVVFETEKETNNKMNIKYKENGKIDYIKSILGVFNRSIEGADFTSSEIKESMFGPITKHTPGQIAYVSEVLGKMINTGTISKDGSLFMITEYTGTVDEVKPGSLNGNTHTEEEEEEEDNIVEEAYKLHASYPDAKPIIEVNYKYDENGEIDLIDTIILILSMNPGATGIQIAEELSTLVDIKDTLTVLAAMSIDGSDGQTLIENEGIYFLCMDAHMHDMGVVKKTMDTLRDEDGIDQDTINFLASGVVMKAEKTVADANKENYDIMHSQAASPAESLVKERHEPIADNLMKNVDDALKETDELPDNYIDPFENLSSEDKIKLKEEADALILADIQKTEQASYIKKVKSITNGRDLLGTDVEINPGKFEGTVIGTILELRPTGLQFIVTDSTDKNVDTGTILNYEYSTGINYKLLVD